MWTTQQERLVARNELCEVRRLVYIEVVAASQVFKILKTEGEFPDRIHRSPFLLHEGTEKQQMGRPQP